MENKELEKAIISLTNDISELSVDKRASVTALWGIIPYSGDGVFTQYKIRPVLEINKIGQNRYRFDYETDDFPEGKEMVYNICKLWRYVPIQRLFKGRGNLIFTKEQIIYILNQIPVFMHAYCGRSHFVKKVALGYEALMDDMKKMNLPYEINELQERIIEIQEGQLELPALRKKLNELQELEKKNNE